MAATADSPGRVLVASGILFCLSVGLTAYTARRPEVAGVGGAIVAEVARPGAEFYSWIGSGIADAWGRYGDLRSVAVENTQLRSKVDALEADNIALLEVKDENRRLRGLLGMVESLKLQGVAAQVIAREPSNWVQTVTINQGSQAGILVGSAVVEGSGLVGQVVGVSRNTSIVQLLTDHNSSVDALLQEGRGRGVIEGTGGERCWFRYVHSDDDMKIGDRVVTSGIDGLFPKGLLVGVVSMVERTESAIFQLVEIQPAVDLRRLEDVFVVRPNEVVRELKEQQQPVSASTRKVQSKKTDGGIR